MESIERIEVEVEWKQFDFLSAISGLYTESVSRRKCKLSVFVQGDLSSLGEKMAFITVHDVGKNHLSFVRFVNSASMAPIKARGAVFLHICVPGQEFGAADLVGSFPSMDQLGDALAQVLQKLNVSQCIAMGEGAGADIACRFAMDFPAMVKGLVLIHCTSTIHGIVEHIKEILMNLRLEDGEMNHAGWNYLLTHRFGNHDRDEEQQHYMEGVKQSVNERNLSRYLHSFGHRSDFTDQLREKLANLNVFLVTGGKAPHNDNMMHMFNNMEKESTGLLMVENVADVLEEAPENVASAMILLAQRQGLFADVALPIISQGQQSTAQPARIDGGIATTDLVFSA